MSPATAKALHIAGTGDFNADGRVDILWRNDNGQVITRLLKQRSDRVDDQRRLGIAIFRDRGTADVNGDGTDYILWRNDDGRAAASQLGGGHLASVADLGTAPPTWQIGGSHFDLV